MPKKVEAGRLEVVSEDTRRSISEFDMITGNILIITVTGNAGPLGQHFHRGKTEVFTLIKGTGTVQTAPVDEDGKICGPISKYEMDANGDGITVISIPSFITHRFDLEEGSVLHVHSSAPFDQEDLCKCPID